MSVYQRFTLLDLADASQLAAYGLSVKVQDNVSAFRSLDADPILNLGCRAVSPFTGKMVAAKEHFGIDSDPWMHSILFEEEGREFIVICQGLTNASHLGSVVLPKEKLILCHHGSWYYNGAYLSRIERNLPRILNHFRFRKSQKTTGKAAEGSPQMLNIAIGNQRLGDYIMQLMLLDELLRHPGRGSAFDIGHIYVNKASEFMEVEALFPEVGALIRRQNSFSHIEYHSRYFNAYLFSDVRVLTSRRELSRLRQRIQAWLKADANRERHAHLLEPLEACGLVIWISPELEKRVWAEQETALPALINERCRKVLPPGKKVGILFNGMTGYVGKELSETVQKIQKREKAMARKIARQLQHPAVVEVLSGNTMTEKLVYAAAADFVLAPLGSASILPSLLLEKPGIVYAFDAEARASFAGSQTVILDKRHIRERADLKAAVKFDMANQSYSIDWKEINREIDRKFSFTKVKQGRVAIGRKTTGGA